MWRQRATWKLFRFDREMKPIMNFGRGIHACLADRPHGTAGPLADITHPAPNRPPGDCALGGSLACERDADVWSCASASDLVSLANPSCHAETPIPVRVAAWQEIETTIEKEVHERKEDHYEYPRSDHTRGRGVQPV